VIRSDAGPWLTLWNDDMTVPHVMPGFGPPHETSLECWCHPYRDDETFEFCGVVVVHCVAQ
jgi:hypothetical protein